MASKRLTQPSKYLKLVWRRRSRTTIRLSDQLIWWYWITRCLRRMAFRFTKR